MQISRSVQLFRMLRHDNSFWIAEYYHIQLIRPLDKKLSFDLRHVQKPVIIHNNISSTVHTWVIFILLL